MQLADIFPIDLPVVRRNLLLLVTDSSDELGEVKRMCVQIDL